jgi:hypothetical protein
VAGLVGGAVGRRSRREERTLPMGNTSRRRLLTGLAGAGTSLALAVELLPEARSALAAASPTPSTSASGNIGQVDAPTWSFALRTFDNPYTGKLQFPSTIPNGSRVVRAEVIIINASDQPLDFQATNVHLLDSEGTEYPAGNAQGGEPKLVSQTLPNGERSRGSVWFIVPNSAELASVRFYPPSPQMTIPLPSK